MFRGEVVLDGNDEDVGEACEGAKVGVEGGVEGGAEEEAAVVVVDEDGDGELGAEIGAELGDEDGDGELGGLAIVDEDGELGAEVHDLADGDGEHCGCRRRVHWCGGYRRSGWAEQQAPMFDCRNRVVS